MAAPQKYLFDVSFDMPGPLPGMPGAEPHFTRADLEAARAEGIAEGREAAFAEAAAAVEERIAASLDAIGRHATAMLELREALSRDTQVRAIGVLRTVLEKAVPALCRKDPLAEIEAMVTECLAEVLDEPRLVLRVSDALFDAVQQRIAGVAQTSGYAGKVILLADAALAACDGRVEWADGGAERDTSRMAHDIDACLTRALAAPVPHALAEENPNG